MKRRIIRFAAVGAVAIAATVPAAGQRPALGMLDQLEKGMWELRFRDGETGNRRMCLGDGRRLIQLRHTTTNCERLVVKDSPNDVTVQYTCPGQGYGRTSIRRETNRLVQIDSQGISDGLPFVFAAEARRIGSC